MIAIFNIASKDSGIATPIEHFSQIIPTNNPQRMETGIAVIGVIFLAMILLSTTKCLIPKIRTWTRILSGNILSLLAY